MRRTFAQARKAKPEAALEAYDALYERLRDMAGPVAEKVETLL
jgi:hypothetical protein